MQWREKNMGMLLGLLPPLAWPPAGSTPAGELAFIFLHLWKSMRADLPVAVVEDLMARLLLLFRLWMVGLWVLVLHYWHHHHYHWQRVFPLRQYHHCPEARCFRQDQLCRRLVWRLRSLLQA
jgi:hypothetical protein